MEELEDKVWWNRYQVRQEKIARGERPAGTSSTELKRVKRIETRYGAGNLGWSDFEWGQLNGKFSTLRWVTGWDWDILDL